MSTIDYSQCPTCCGMCCEGWADRLKEAERDADGSKFLRELADAKARKLEARGARLTARLEEARGALREVVEGYGAAMEWLSVQERPPVDVDDVLRDAERRIALGDAALAASPGEVCETCEGDGRRRYDGDAPHIGHPNGDECPDCKGTGISPGEPEAQEQV